MAKRSSAGIEASICGGKHPRKSIESAQQQQQPQPMYKVKSLLQISARMVAAKIPFELVETRYKVVPEPVIRLLITYAVPRSEEDVRRYTSTSASRSTTHRCDDDDNQESSRATGASSNRQYAAAAAAVAHATTPSNNRCYSRNNLTLLRSEHSSFYDRNFRQGVRLAETGGVRNTLQIGFYLSGQVVDRTSGNGHHVGYVSPSTNSSGAHYRFETDLLSCQKNAGIGGPGASMTSHFDVSLTFDRCKIKDFKCSCASGSAVFLCRHLVALIIFRMRNPDKVEITLPIADTLRQFSRDQLQKLIQHLLHHNKDNLAESYRVSKQLMNPVSTINRIHGAPDPSAGAGTEDEDLWCLDEVRVKAKVHRLLYDTRNNCRKNLLEMIRKIREMMMVRDANASRLLLYVTQQLFDNPAPYRNFDNVSWSEVNVEMEILWCCVVSDPDNHHHQHADDKRVFLDKLKYWNSVSNAELEHFAHTNPDDDEIGRPEDTNGVFWHALTLGELAWYPSKIKGYLNTIRSSNARFSVRHDEIYAAVCPNDNYALACTRVEALRSHGYLHEALLLAYVIAQKIRQSVYDTFQTEAVNNDVQAPEMIPGQCPAGQGVIGHPLNPLLIVVDTLLIGGHECTKHTHNLFNAANLRGEAFTVTFSALGEARKMPVSHRGQKQVLSCERTLVDRLQQVRCDSDIRLLKQQRTTTHMLLQAGVGSAFGQIAFRESSPVLYLGRFIFRSLFQFDCDLAFKVGIRLMRIPKLGDLPDRSPYQNRRIVMTTDRRRMLQHPYYRDPFSSTADMSLARSTPIHIRTVFPDPGGNVQWPCMGDLENLQFELTQSMVDMCTGCNGIPGSTATRELLKNVKRFIQNCDSVHKLSKHAAGQGLIMRDVALQLAIQVLSMTISVSHCRREDKIDWLVKCAFDTSFTALKNIIETWYKYASPEECCTVMTSSIEMAVNSKRYVLTNMHLDEISQIVGKMNIECARHEPQSCVLRALKYCEKSGQLFERAYSVGFGAATERRIDTSLQFSMARYLQDKRMTAKAFNMALCATKQLSDLPIGQESGTCENLMWSLQLACMLGLDCLRDLLEAIISSVKCPNALSEILHKCTTLHMGRLQPFCPGSAPVPYGCHSPQLGSTINRLLKTTMNSYVKTINAKLEHISPRHYSEFIDFLSKAHTIFLFAANGALSFKSVVEDLKRRHKGKKKLVQQITMRFG